MYNREVCESYGNFIESFQDNSVIKTSFRIEIPGLDYDLYLLDCSIQDTKLNEPKTLAILYASAVCKLLDLPEGQDREVNIISSKTIMFNFGRKMVMSNEDSARLYYVAKYEIELPYAILVNDKYYRLV